ncbi:MAG: hypothetical protein JOZ96_05885 [Acidobacteria bacterium]|nr:hypothetical protein [Acidobacteriota bacterium]
MRRLTFLLACTALLAANAAAQTAPAKEAVLEIHRFGWFEATAPMADRSDTAYQVLATLKWRQEHAAGRGDYGVAFVVKNVTRKPIKSVSLGFVFRDAATGRVFLTYNRRFDERIGPGEKRALSHTIKKGEEPDSFSPAAPSAALLEYTRSCGDRSVYFDPKSGKLVERKVREGEKSIPDFCSIQPAVTRIVYEDGTFWQP